MGRVPSSLGKARRPVHSGCMARRFAAHRAPTPKTAIPVTLGAAGGTLRPDPNADRPAPKPREQPREIGGPEGPEPTRYGDWERKGICVDF